MKEFSFNYFTSKNSVAIDDYLIKVRVGPFIKKEFQQANLQSFYVFHNGQYRSVFFVYTDDKGKMKKTQVFSTPAEMGFTELVNELNARFPSKSLNHLSEAEAFKAMKMANPKKWAPFVAIFLIFFVMCGILYPQLRHYFDHGFANATVAEVGEKKDFGTRNISINGVLLDQSLKETTTTKGSSTVSLYIPMVDTNWKEGDPVKVILSFKELSDDEYSQAIAGTDFTGVVRNIAWEGIGKDQTDFFTKTYGMHFDGKPVLVEITNEKHNDEFVLFVVGLVVVILIAVFIIVAVKRKRAG